MNALFCDGVGTPSFFVVGKDGSEESLDFGVIVFAHVAFLDFAVDEVDVGLIARVEVLVDGE